MSRRWGAHLLLVGVLAAQVAIWAVGHRSTAQLESSVRKGAPAERLAALQVLLERGEPDPVRYGGMLAGDLLAESDERLRELAFTTAVSKHSGAENQLRDLKRLQDADRLDAAFWRAFVVMRRKIGVVVGGSSGRLKRKELDWWLEALEGRAPPAEEIRAHIEKNP